jgi:hypothetical protein
MSPVALIPPPTYKLVPSHFKLALPAGCPELLYIISVSSPAIGPADPVKPDDPLNPFDPRLPA